VTSKTTPFWLPFLAFALLAITPSLAFSQEGEMRVVDEVIAQVNDDVITLSMLKREIKERIEALKQNGMSDQQASDEVNKRRDELIATLVNEQLLLQKGKELELSEKVEAEVNRRMLQIAKEQNIPTIEKLYQAMRDSGIVPEDVRQTMRTEMMKQAVIQEEVDSKIFWGLSMEELHKYFDAHKDKFRKPENVTISEIFLGLAGKNEPEVKAKADQLVAQLRSGADFVTLAVTYSERQDQSGNRLAPKDKGKVGTFPVPELREDTAGAIKNVKAGGVSDPLKSPDGYQILRVDERTAASDASVFNENKVREVITVERSPKAREDYLQNLRNEAYIKISKDYSAGVLPLLKIKEEPIAEKTEDTGTVKASERKKEGKGKFLKIFPKP
jgi:peptidyl-prolyl cis-trans isomerase SurA